LYSFLVSPVCGTCPSHFILIYLINLLIFGDKPKLWSFSLYRSLQHPVTSFTLCPFTARPLFVKSHNNIWLVWTSVATRFASTWPVTRKRNNFSEIFEHNRTLSNEDANTGRNFAQWVSETGGV
jgi:hypothetical protein